MSYEPPFCLDCNHRTAAHTMIEPCVKEFIHCYGYNQRWILGDTRRHFPEIRRTTFFAPPNYVSM
jgi:hypothetical protein